MLVRGEDWTRQSYGIKKKLKVHILNLKHKLTDTFSFILLFNKLFILVEGRHIH